MTFGQGKSESLNTQASSAAPTRCCRRTSVSPGVSAPGLQQTRPGPGTDSGVPEAAHSAIILSLSLSPSPCSPLKLATEGHPCLDDACSGKKKVYGCALGTVTFYSLKFPWKLRASGFSAPAHPSRKTGLPPSSVCSGVLKQPARDLSRADRRLFGPASRRAPFGSGTSGG